MWLQNLFLSDCLVRISYQMADDQNPTLHRQTLPLSVSLTQSAPHNAPSVLQLTRTALHFPKKTHTPPQSTICQNAVGACQAFHSHTAPMNFRITGKIYLCDLTLEVDRERQKQVVSTWQQAVWPTDMTSITGRFYQQ